MNRTSAVHGSPVVVQPSSTILEDERHEDHRYEAVTQARFEDLQAKLVPLWKSIREFGDEEQTIVVVPSMSLDMTFRGSEMKSYEERFLFLLLLLRQPHARMIYVTSQPIHPDIVDYYLHLLPGVIASHARKRLFLISPIDGSTQPLSQKILDRPRLIGQIRSLIPDRDRAHLVPYNTTELERDLAVELGIPMYGSDPRFLDYGTKGGSRRLFAEEGVSHPVGADDVSDVASIVDGIASIRARRPHARQVVVKLNDGVAGEGNAILTLDNLPASGASEENAAIEKRLADMQFEQATATVDGYLGTLAAMGGVVEERIVGAEFRSPSAQLRITPLGEVEALSTHDQVLGGPSGQSYFGARFPADRKYSVTIMRDALKIGRRLAREGVIGRLAVDFVAVRDAGGEWKSYAIEINLRKGGTTHPFLTLQFLTDGKYDAERGTFRTPRGEEKCFVSSDHLESPAYRAFTHEDLFDLVARHGLHFDQARQTGVVFHMMSTLGDRGRMGVTAVGDTCREADELYARTVQLLDEEALALLDARRGFAK